MQNSQFKIVLFLGVGLFAGATARAEKTCPASFYAPRAVGQTFKSVTNITILDKIHEECRDASVWRVVVRAKGNGILYLLYDGTTSVNVGSIVEIADTRSFNLFLHPTQHQALRDFRSLNIGIVPYGGERVEIETVQLERPLR